MTACMYIIKLWSVKKRDFPHQNLTKSTLRYYSGAWNFSTVLAKNRKVYSDHADNLPHVFVT